jgi:hypothetical protein
MCVDGQYVILREREESDALGHLGTHPREGEEVREDDRGGERAEGEEPLRAAFMTMQHTGCLWEGGREGDGERK